MNVQTLHRELVTNHNTFSKTTKYGRVSARKTHGRFKVAFEDFELGKVTKQNFATLRGAQIALQGWEGML